MTIATNKATPTLKNNIVNGNTNKPAENKVTSSNSQLETVGLNDNIDFNNQSLNFGQGGSKIQNISNF